MEKREDYDANSTSEDFEVVKELDFSSEGQCTVVRSAHTGIQYVMKAIRCKVRRTEHANGMVSEHLDYPKEALITLKHMNHLHPNIIDTFECEQIPDTGFCEIRMEYCDGGDLSTLIKRFVTSPYHVPELLLCHVANGLIQALAYLHHGILFDADQDTFKQLPDEHWDCILHRDIKPHNIFLRWRAPRYDCNLPDVVLGDFGHVCLAGHSYGPTGTSIYFPPEVRDERERIQDLKDLGGAAHNYEPGIMTTKSDVYTIGATLHQLGTLEHPWEGQTPTKKLPSDIYADRKIHRAVRRCLMKDPADRPSAAEVLHVIPGLRGVMEAAFKSEGGVSECAYDDDVMAEIIADREEREVGEDSDGRSHESS